MQKLALSVVFALMIGAAGHAAAGNCFNDQIVERWVRERDAAAVQVLRKWAGGIPVEDLAPEIAVIFADEIYILSKCREQTEFLNTNVYVISGSDPQIETVPGIILKKVLGRDILSPTIQFPR